MRLHLPIERAERTRSRLARCVLALSCVLVVVGGSATNGYADTATPDATTGSPAVDGGLGLGAVLCTVVYAPVKLVYALSGSMVGALAWAFTGGDGDAARGVMAPAVYGDYVVTPDHLRNPRSLEFFGREPTGGYDAIASNGTGELPPVSARPPGLRSDGTVDCAAVSTLPAVHFGFEQSQVGTHAAGTLDQVATVLQSCPDLTVDIQAHTDITGTDAFNVSLSEARASSVSDYLVHRGIARDRLATEGFGSSQPIASNETGTGRALNRRAELPIR